jgi:hypothetical protein
VNWLLQFLKNVFVQKVSTLVLYVDLGNIFQVLKMDFSRISSWAWAGKLLH